MTSFSATAAKQFTVVPRGMAQAAPRREVIRGTTGPAAPRPALDMNKSGPISFPVKVQVGNAKVDATFVGTAIGGVKNPHNEQRAGSIKQPRIVVAGTQYLLSDGALRQVLKDGGGYTPDHESSSQTKVFNDSFLADLAGALVGYGTKAVDVSDGQLVLRRVTQGYYHDDSVAVNWPYDSPNRR